MSTVMVLIAYDRAIDDEIGEILTSLELKQYTKWKDVSGVGKHEPHFGNQVWPGLNNVTMAVIDEEKKEILLRKIRALQGGLPFVALRAFVLPVLDMV